MPTSDAQTDKTQISEEAIRQTCQELGMTKLLLNEANIRIEVLTRERDEARAAVAEVATIRAELDGLKASLGERPQTLSQAVARALVTETNVKETATSGAPATNGAAKNKGGPS